MPEKPGSAAGYTRRHLERVISTGLYVATKLGDLMDELVIIGGLVPSLIIDQHALTDGSEAHVGTVDLDLGLAVGLLDGRRYTALTERLRRAGFSQDENADGHPTRQRWLIREVAKVTVDFLIQPTRPEDRGGQLRDIEPDFAAIIAPGLHLAFEDRICVPLSGIRPWGG